MDHSGAAADAAAAFHRDATTAYARTFCQDSVSAGGLVADAVERGRRANVYYGGPESAWLPFLLAMVRRTAGEWAASPRAVALSPGFTAWYGRLVAIYGPGDPIRRAEDSSALLRAFDALADRPRHVLWHTVVEAEGSSGEDLADAEAAVDALRDTYLRLLADHAQHPACRHYSRMLGAVVRRTNQHASPDLERHLSTCAVCSAAYRDLFTVVGYREALATELLLWGADAYLATRDRQRHGRPLGAPAEGPSSSGAGGRGRRRIRLGRGRREGGGGDGRQAPGTLATATERA
jgi:hypothetical protein